MIIDSARYEDIPELTALWKEAFSDGDEFIDAFFKTAFSPDRSMCAKENGKLLAMLHFFDCECDGGRVAYIYAVATAKAYRGRGICRALLEKTHQILAKKGYTGAALVPFGDALFAFYEKIGYKTATFVNEFFASAGGADIAIEKIGKEKYAELRRIFLPPHSVIQEKENIDFLNTDADFYVGDGFLLAAHREEKTLFGVELLGNESLAGAILGALGCEKGKFRTPYGEKPFSMYFPFEKNKQPPKYFGLAFD